MDHLDLDERSSALKVVLEAKTGAAGAPMTAARGSRPLVLIYKVMGKMFAILAVRGTPNVILKCDPHLAEVLRGHYRGIGHRSHLDPGSGSASISTRMYRPARSAGWSTTPTSRCVRD